MQENKTKIKVIYFDKVFVEMVGIKVGNRA